MTTLRNSVYFIVVAGSVAMAACQPAETSAERVDNDIAKAAHQLRSQLEQSVAGQEAFSKVER